METDSSPAGRPSPGHRELTRRSEIEFKLETLAKLKVGHGKRGTSAYLPHRGQEALHFPGQPWQYVVCPWGRRSGKTLAAAAEIVHEIGLGETRIWIVAPNYELTDRVFDYVYDWLVRRKVYGDGSVVKASKTKDQRYIEMAWGAFVRGKSADSPDSLVGEQLDLIVFDECARCHEGIWLENLEPTTIDRKGRVIFISTPRGLNWFWKYFQRGLNPETRERGWSSVQFKTEENPWVDGEWLKSKRMETPDDVWKQEYEGDFTSMSGLVWPDYTDRPYPDGHIYNPDDLDLDGTLTYYRAIDIGWRHPTACVWGAADKNNNVYIYREYEEQNVVHEVHAEAIAALTAEPIATTYISPDAKRKNPLQKKGSPEERLCALDIYRRAGVYARPASDNVGAGIATVAKYLRSTLQDQSQHPKLLISRECPKLRRALQNYIFQEVQTSREIDAPDKPRKYQDDLPDAFRYLLAPSPRYRSTWIEEQEYMEPTPRPRRDGVASVPYYG